jgi:predicted DNA-binding protein YlxM (UPF0122 family)
MQAQDQQIEDFRAVARLIFDKLAMSKKDLESFHNSLESLSQDNARLKALFQQIREHLQNDAMASDKIALITSLL